MMGIRAVIYKEHIKTTATKLIFGESIRHTREFLSSFPSEPYSSEFRHFRFLCPKPASSHGTKSTFVHPGLENTSYVFIRRNLIKSSIQKAISRYPESLWFNTRRLHTSYRRKNVQFNLYIQL